MIYDCLFKQYCKNKSAVIPEIGFTAGLIFIITTLLFILSTTECAVLLLHNSSITKKLISSNMYFSRNMAKCCLVFFSASGNRSQRNHTHFVAHRIAGQLASSLCDLYILVLTSFHILSQMLYSSKVLFSVSTDDVASNTVATILKQEVEFFLYTQIYAMMHTAKDLSMVLVNVSRLGMPLDQSDQFSGWN